jgi:5-carboxymethyl-2-hydroxymuconate isomerase
MPHFVVDCSSSVLELADPVVLMQSVYDAAESTGLFAEHGLGGIKVRLNPYDRYVNVDGHQHFVHVFAHIMQGRSPEQKRVLAEKVVEAVAALLPGVEIISVSVSDFERATYANATMLRPDDAKGG